MLQQPSAVKQKQKLLVQTSWECLVVFVTYHREKETESLEVLFKLEGFGR